MPPPGAETVGGFGWELVEDVFSPSAPPPSSIRRSSAADPYEIERVEEIYLELARVDPEDVESMLDFIARFRTLAVRSGNFAAFENFPGFENVVRPNLEAAWQPGIEPPFGVRLDEGLEDFRFGVLAMRDLVQAWRVLSGEIGAAAWESLPSGIGVYEIEQLEALQQHGETPSPADEAASFLVRVLSPALRPFQPRLVDPHWISLGQSYVVANTPLYSICCLELYNHILVRDPYRRCANPTCGRLFVRQRGRAAAGQYRRSGVIYCSRSCANAAVQRRFRERRKMQLERLDSSSPQHEAGFGREGGQL